MSDGTGAGSTSVAVVGGTGDLGFALASRWVKAGLDVIVGSRDAARAADAADSLAEMLPEGRVRGMANADAVQASALVVVAVPFSGVVAIYRSIAEHLRSDAVVVDATVPIEASVGGKATHVFGVWEGSAAQLGQAFLPEGTTMCAAFHTLSASTLGDLDRQMDGDVLVCGARAGKERVRPLVEAIPGLRYVDAGALEMARIVEPITALLIGINRRYKVHDAGIRITGI